MAVAVYVYIAILATMFAFFPQMISEPVFVAVCSVFLRETSFNCINAGCLSWPPYYVGVDPYIWTSFGRKKSGKMGVLLLGARVDILTKTYDTIETNID